MWNCCWGGCGSGHETCDIRPIGRLRYEPPKTCSTEPAPLRNGVRTSYLFRGDRHENGIHRTREHTEPGQLQVEVEYVPGGMKMVTSRGGFGAVFAAMSPEREPCAVKVGRTQPRTMWYVRSRT